MSDNTNKETNSNANDWKDREIGALWRREGKNQRYLSGKLTIGDFGEEKTINVVIFSNRFKEKDNQPDFRIYEDRPREEVAQASEAPKQTEEVVDVDADLPSVLQ